MKCGLIGEKLGHSFSAEIHALAGTYSYELWPMAPEALDGFMKKRDFSGINVTIPYKRAVIPYLSSLSPEAEACGAVNTVVNREGKLYGYNTDILGMGAMLSFGGISLEGKRVLILGTGGTAGTAKALCLSRGVASVKQVSRRPEGDAVSYEEALSMKDTDVILNTTPCGMFPHGEDRPIDLSAFPRLSGVADVIYHPLRTRLILQAEELGIPAVSGLYMLVAQAVYAAGLFMDKPTREEDILPIYRSLLQTKENIYLTGMPGAGKSTVGKALAADRGAEFFDTDEWITETQGRTPAEIISQEGEAVFRNVETEAVRTLCEKRGAVIATGGGAVLREENVRLMRQNGRVIFLDAPLETLTATSDRPLSSTPEALAKRYGERYGIYCGTCDKRIAVTRDLEENKKALEEVLA